MLSLPFSGKKIKIQKKRKTNKKIKIKTKWMRGQKRKEKKRTKVTLSYLFTKLPKDQAIERK
jgi:type IV secretory pathway component VirB8